MPISYTQSNFREKQYVNGNNPAKQAYKIWRKNFFQGLPSYHILGIGSFLAAPCKHKKSGYHLIVTRLEIMMSLTTACLCTKVLKTVGLVYIPVHINGDMRHSCIANSKNH